VSGGHGDEPEAKRETAEGAPHAPSPPHAGDGEAEQLVVVRRLHEPADHAADVVADAGPRQRERADVDDDAQR
jgi:hypothetical protein